MQAKNKESLCKVQAQIRRKPDAGVIKATPPPPMAVSQIYKKVLDELFFVQGTGRAQAVEQEGYIIGCWLKVVLLRETNILEVFVGDKRI